MKVSLVVAFTDEKCSASYSRSEEAQAAVFRQYRQNKYKQQGAKIGPAESSGGF